MIRFFTPLLTSTALLAAVPLPALAQAHTVAQSVAPGLVRQHSAPRNVIFILLDDLRFDGMGFLQPGLHTPNIDRLARGGTYFPNAVVTSALCSPSRATILTGMTARNHGIVDNNDSSEAGLTFFPAYMQQAGYQTAFFGKWHMGQASDDPRPGFDRWVSFPGQGNYYPSPSGLNVDGEHVPQRGYITDELTDYALDWLDHGRDPAKPFFLYLSHKAVHSDPLPAERHRGQYADHQFALPASAANTPENNAGKPRWVLDQRNTWHGIDFFYNTDLTMPEYLREYYGALSSVDDSVGRVMAWLEGNGLADDTMIVFTADNGYMIGDHGLIDKRTAYEPSVRVPLVVYSPGHVPAGVTNTGRIRNLDWAPTFLDMAGINRPEQFEGISAWPLMSGEVRPDQWQAPDFVYEYYWEWTFPMTPGTFAITRGNMKYIQYYGVYDREELYDLATDPDEMHNLIDDPAHFQTRIALRQALFDQLANRDGRHVIPYTQRLSTGAVRRGVDGTRGADFPAEWYVVPNRADRMTPIIPDSPDKQRAIDEGRPVLPAPIPGRESVPVNR
jgi:arylsulfatase A-like enzyme